MMSPLRRQTRHDLAVPASSLGPRLRLNHGANGIIHALGSFRLDDEAGELVYKQYQGGACHVSLHGLLGIIDARLRLPADRRRAFDRLTVWPLRVVVDDDGRPAGVLMRLIPDDFMERIKLPSGRRRRIPREVQHLIFDAAAARRHEVAVPSDRDLRTRVRICERLAFIVAIMHRAHLVYGDISARNVLYRLSPQPSVLLVDCDAARVHGSGAVNRQQNSPDWDPPETEPATASRSASAQSQDTDRYKLALFILRCLTPGRGSSTNRRWTVAARLLDAKGRELMTKGLEGTPGERPLAREWVYYLRARLGQNPLPARPAPGAVVAPQQHTTHTGWRRGVNGQWSPY